MLTYRLLVGDVRETLKALPDGCVQTCVTSPPFWGLRDYGHGDQIGLEASPDAYVQQLVAVFREVRRVLRDDATCWINLGDSYNSIGGTNGGGKSSLPREPTYRGWAGLKPKDLCMIPARVALALQADGWWLRSEIIWSKPNPMPESVTDRPTKAHEYIFLLTKQPTYYYDQSAIAEDVTDEEYRTVGKIRPTAEGGPGFEIRGGLHNQIGGRAFRNKRSVWHVATQPYPEAHFATFPEALIEPCILAGTSEKGCCPSCGAPLARMTDRDASVPQRSGAWKATGQAHRNDIDRKGGFYDSVATTLGWQPTCACDAGEPVPCTVLDPFCGSGTTGAVAIRHQRSFIGVELNPAYATLARTRISGVAPLFAEERTA